MLDSLIDYLYTEGPFRYRQVKELEVYLYKMAPGLYNKFREADVGIDLDMEAKSVEKHGAIKVMMTIVSFRIQAIPRVS